MPPTGDPGPLADARADPAQGLIRDGLINDELIVNDGYHFVGEGYLLDDRYRLDELIGTGGTAEVYRGTDELLGRAVAIKVFDARLTDLNTIVRQRNEMQVLARLTHPNLIAVYDARIAEPLESGGRTAARTYLVLELVLGYTLADLIRQGPIPPEQVNRIGLTLASVLQVVHGQDLVHRDIKPANVLLAETGQIKLGDFGLARILTAEDRLTAGADVMGTAAYFSPEQARAGVVGPPADIYSLGLVLLECLTGHKEFPGDAVAAAVARLLRDPFIPASLPGPWPALLTAMTQSNPQLRPTASQVRAILVGAPQGPGDSGGLTRGSPRDSTGAEAPTVEWSSPMTPFLSSERSHTAGRRRRRGPVVVGLGAAIAIAAAAIWLTTPADSPGPVANPRTDSGAAHPAPPAPGPASGTTPTSTPATTVPVTKSPPPTRIHPPSAARALPGTTAPSPTVVRSQSIPTPALKVAAVMTSTTSTPAAAMPATAPEPTSTRPGVTTSGTPAAATPTTAAPSKAHPGNGNGNGQKKPKPPKKSKK